VKSLIIKKELLLSIKYEQKFIEAIQLSRILSAIQYNKVIYAKVCEKDDIDSSLQLNLVINHAAVLYEGIKKFNTLKAKFKDLESYKENFDEIEKIFKEAEKENIFYKNVLYKVRKKVAFHFDKHVITKMLGEFISECVKEDKEVIFIQGKTELVKDMTFRLANNMNFRYILKLVGGKNLSYEEKFKKMAKELLDLSKLFCGVLEEIISELVKDYCILKEEEST